MSCMVENMTFNTKKLDFIDLNYEVMIRNIIWNTSFFYLKVFIFAERFS